MMVDGTTCNHKMGGVYLAICTITPSHIILPLALAYVPAENNESYRFLFENCSFIPEDLDFTLLADQHSSIKNYVKEIFSFNYCPCGFHIAQKMQKQRTEFFRLLKSEHQDLLQARIRLFEKEYPKDFLKFKKYLKILPILNSKELRMDFVADSCIESLNKILIPVRKSHPIVAINFFIGFSYTQLNNFNKSLDGTYILQYAQRKIKENEQTAKSLLRLEKNVEYQSFIIHQSFVDSRSLRFHVNLIDEKLKCECRGTERYGLPCPHICFLSMIYPQKYHINDYIHPMYKTQNLLEIYMNNRNFIKPNTYKLYRSVGIKIPDRIEHPGRKPRVRIYKKKDNSIATPRNFFCKICDKNTIHSTANE